MRRIGIAGLVGALAMGFLSYVPVVGWMNLLLGLWFFVGGLIAAATWTRLGDGTRGIFPSILSAALGGALLAGASGLYILVSVENFALEAGKAEFLADYPAEDRTTEQILDYWDGYRDSLAAGVQDELARMEAEAEGQSSAAYRLRQNLSKLEEMKVKMARLRTDHAREVSRGDTGFVDWMAQTSHELILSLRGGDASMVRMPLLFFILLRAVFIVGVAMGGGILGALVFGHDPEEVPAVEPEPEPAT